MLTYLKHDFSRIKKVLIVFGIVILILSIGISIVQKLESESNYKLERYYKILEIEEIKLYEQIKEKNGEEYVSKYIENGEGYEEYSAKASKIFYEETGLDNDILQENSIFYNSLFEINIVAIAITIAIFIAYSILRYRENLVREEGYLTFTLPVRAESILISKYITGIITPLVILSIGFLIAYDGRSIYNYLFAGFFLATIIAVFISFSYLMITLSKTGNKFFEKTWGLFIGMLIVIVSLFIITGNLPWSLLRSMENTIYNGIPYMDLMIFISGLFLFMINIVIAFINCIVIRKKLEI